MGTLSNNSKIGDKNKDLILQTSGNVYIQIKDRFYKLKFKDEDNNENEDKENNEEEEITDSKVIFSEELNLNYPGDNYLIVSDNQLYRTLNQQYIPIQTSSKNDTFTNPITITTLESPLIINSSKLVQNLNAQYLNSISSKNFLRKDLEDTVSKCYIKELRNNTITGNNAIINLETGYLNIDTIRVKNLIWENYANDTEESDSIVLNYDLLNKKTYFSNGIKLLEVKKVDKMESFKSIQRENSQIEYYANENYLVGGFSIIDLILNAFEKGYLTELSTIYEYANALTECLKLNETLNWETHTLTESDFIETEGVLPYKQYKFYPKDSSIYSSYKYNNTSTCLEAIYNKWYNIENYIEDIAAKYKGTTFECIINNCELLPGDILHSVEEGKLIEALVVGVSDTKIRLIISGSDCLFENKIKLSEFEEWEEFVPTEEPNLSIYNSILECINSQKSEKGKTISLDLTENDILINDNYINIIGNISGINNNIFGKIEDFGIYSEGNCYFINPNFTLTNNENKPYIKLSNKANSFIGGSEELPWINIESNGNNFIKYSNMYDINTTGTCFFGPFTIYKDGSAVIGTGSNVIRIDSLGNITIPKSCIVE